jgi:hypothetical protein
MAIRKTKKGKGSFQPVDFDKEFQGGTLTSVAPPEPPKKSFDEVVASIQRELELVSVGLSKHCAMAIQFTPEKSPFCRVLKQFKFPVTGNQAQELIRLAFQDFGNKFAEFVKEELRNLF